MVMGVGFKLFSFDDETSSPVDDETMARTNTI